MIDPSILFTVRLSQCLFVHRVAHQSEQENWIDVFRPNMSERNPEAKAPTKEPPGMAAEMPPCTEALGPEQSLFSAVPVP